MTEIPQMPQIEKGVYEHYKGNRYEVVSMACHTETLEPLVIYRPLYESDVPFFARPFSGFFDIVQKDGDSIPRFKKISGES